MNEPDMSACNAQAGAEIGQIGADFEIGRFEIGSKVNPHFVHGLKGEKGTARFFSII